MVRLTLTARACGKEINRANQRWPGFSGIISKTEALVVLVLEGQASIKKADGVWPSLGNIFDVTDAAGSGVNKACEQGGFILLPVFRLSA